MEFDIEQVVRIREMYDSESYSILSIAEAFDATFGEILEIVTS